MINLFDLISFLIPCIMINAFLNLFYETKKQYGYIEYDKPFDFGLYLRKNRILGESTTWGGLIISILVGAIIQLAFSWIPGIIIGLGCFFGHAMGSFIKRRFGYPRGKYFPVLDHGDYVIFTGIILYPNHIDLYTYFFAIFIILILHPLLCIIAFKFRFRDNLL